MKILILFLTLICGINLLAGTIDPSTPDKKHIEYGQEFIFVGQIEGQYDDGSLYMGSAVAIDDHHILTAAHIVKKSVSCTFIINKKKYKITNIKYNKKFDMNKFGEGDIAIGYSAESIGLEKYPELYESDQELGSLCSIAGYGFTGTFETGSLKFDSNIRAGTNTIDYIQDDLLVCSPSKENKTELEFLIASGDSGGGLFINNKLAGINSSVMTTDKNPNSSYNDESCHTRISAHINWINTYRTEKK